MSRHLVFHHLYFLFFCVIFAWTGIFEFFHFLHGLHFFSFMFLMPLLSFLSFIHIWIYPYFISINSYCSCYSLFSRVHFFSVIFIISFIVRLKIYACFGSFSSAFFSCSLFHTFFCSFIFCASLLIFKFQWTVASIYFIYLISQLSWRHRLYIFVLVLIINYFFDLGLFFWFLRAIYFCVHLFLSFTTLHGGCLNSTHIMSSINI